MEMAMNDVERKIACLKAGNIECLEIDCAGLAEEKRKGRMTKERSLPKKITSRLTQTMDIIAHIAENLLKSAMITTCMTMVSMKQCEQCQIDEYERRKQE